MLKRLLSLTMASALCLSGSTFTASAAEESDVLDFYHYMSDYDSLSELTDTTDVLFEGDQAFITVPSLYYYKDVDKINNFIPGITSDGKNYMDYEVKCFGSAEESHKYDLLTKDEYFEETYYLTRAAAYVLVTAKSQGTLTVELDITSAYGVNPWFFNLTVGEDGNFVKEYTKDPPVKGDANTDGKFDISDVVMLQKWLVGSPDASLFNWTAADLRKDGRLDSFDLAYMKTYLTGGLKTTDITPFSMSPSKDNVQEFWDSKMPLVLKNSTVDKLYNITPKEITDKYGFRLYKFEDNYETYIEYNDSVYLVGEGIGGRGTVSFAVADMDMNGTDELYFTHSYGSGLHIVDIGVFDLSTMKWGSFSSQLKDLITVIETRELTFAVKDNKLEVYTAKILKADSVNMQTAPDKLLGEITLKNGRICFDSIK